MKMFNLHHQSSNHRNLNQRVNSVSFFVSFSIFLIVLIVSKSHAFAQNPPEFIQKYEKNTNTLSVEVVLGPSQGPNNSSNSSKVNNEIKLARKNSTIGIEKRIFNNNQTTSSLVTFVNETSRQSANKNKSEVKTNITKIHREDEEVHLISWRWAELGNYFLIGAFLLIAAGVKICYHHSHTLSTHIPESCVLILLGTIVGTIFFFTDTLENEYVPKFNSSTFFYVLLPPIILESAYSLYDKSFFNNIGTILLYAVVGTIINIATIGPSLYYCSEWGIFGSIRIPMIECVIFATLISAVDPVAVLAIFAEVNVNKALYFLVFGESLLNDAVVVTMYNTVSALAGRENIRVTEIVRGILSFLITSGGGVSMGIFLGALSSIVTRFTADVRVVEPLIVICLAYLSYVGAELFHFSGIISLICCGLMQAEYTRHNISKKSYTTIKYLTKTVSSIADVIIFLFLGMVLVRDDHDWNTGFVLFTTIFCIIYRFISVFSLTYFANNFFQRLRIVNLAEQLLMAYGGLRGAIAFCLAIMLDTKKISQANLFVTATLFVILFTVFVLGSTTKPIVRFLQVKIHIKHEAKLFIEINNKVVETFMAGMEEIAGNRSANYWAQKFARFNDNYVKAILIRGGAERAASIRTAYEKFYQGKDDGSRMLIQNVKTIVKEEQEVEVAEGPTHSKLIRACSDGANVQNKNDQRPSTWRLSRSSWYTRRHRTLPARPGPEPYRELRSPKKPDKTEDVSRALAEAFSKSAYYQYTGGIHSVEDREDKITKEIARKSKWLMAKSKIQLAAIASKSSEQGNEPLPLHSVVQAAKALAAMKERQQSESVILDNLNEQV
ncbi:Na(+)/H(+) exchanger protein 7-like [Panonychus citri]|uniref:Na(+)/H(+) exchanger protein 7-like n=1 Tax=Panonychus citri TaxID=50023 RepID=UPI002306E1ED|nr:Na(+)/H(+) exchanger protein 7-like [Panonychus citri]